MVDFDRYTDDRDALTAALAEELGATLVHAYDDPYIISGAGTAGLELVEETGELDALLVCTGGGGLLAGCSPRGACAVSRDARLRRRAGGLGRLAALARRGPARPRRAS